MPHDNRQRLEAIVDGVEQLSPGMCRIALRGNGVDTIASTPEAANPAAWIKVFAPGRQGRAYTIRGFEQSRRILLMDVVLHASGADDGSMAFWASQAKPGDRIEIAGPRDGGFTLLPESTWVWLAGDMSAFPAIQSIIETLPAEVRVCLLCIAPDEGEYRPGSTSSSPIETWWYECDIADDRASRLAAEKAACRRLEGRGQVWIAGEADMVKEWRLFWRKEMALDAHSVHAVGYWKQGEKDHRD